MPVHPGYNLIEAAALRQQDILREAAELRLVKLAAATDDNRSRSLRSRLHRATTAMRLATERWLTSGARADSPAGPHAAPTLEA